LSHSENESYLAGSIAPGNVERFANCDASECAIGQTDLCRCTYNGCGSDNEAGELHFDFFVRVKELIKG